MVKDPSRFEVVCVSNMPYVRGEGFVDSNIPLGNLTLGKKYRAIESNLFPDWYVVWDDFDEDYAYPGFMFKRV